MIPSKGGTDKQNLVFLNKQIQDTELAGMRHKNILMSFCDHCVVGYLTRKNSSNNALANSAKKVPMGLYADDSGSCVQLE